MAKRLNSPEERAKLRTKNNIKFFKSIGKWWGDSILRNSTHNARVLWKVLGNMPKAIPDVIQAVGQLASSDLDDAMSEVIDIVRNVDLVGSVASVTKDDINAFIKNTKELVHNIKEIRESNIANEEKSFNDKKEGEKIMNKKQTKKNKASNNIARNTTARISVAKTNHPEWYLKDSTLVSSLVGINISNRQNAALDKVARISINAATSTPDSIAGNIKYGIPSCASLRTILTIPKSNTNDWAQAVNMLYKNIRSANAGAVNYSPAQLANYILQVRNCDAILSILGRAIKTLNTGTFYDAMSPQSIFAAMGMDYDTFSANAANARELYARLAAIRYRLMPLGITLLDRTRWLYSNVFKDSDDAKSQLYVPIITNIHSITSTGTVKQYQFFEGITSSQTGLVWTKFSERILDLFDDYQRDSIYQLIAGDIQKAYGQSTLYKYPTLYMDNILDPVYDVNVLTQIQNATLGVTSLVNVDVTTHPDDLDKFTTMSITENIEYDADDGLYDTQVAMPINAGVLNRWITDPIYNTNKDVTDPGHLLSSTRFMISRSVSSTTSNDTTAIINYNTYGTEVITDIAVIMLSPQEFNSNIYNLGTYRVNMLNQLVRNKTTGLTATYMPYQSWFDYFPLTIPYTLDIEKKYLVYYPPQFQFNNFGIAYKSNLDSYNAIATLSLLHKPFVSKVNKVEVFEA